MPSQRMETFHGEGKVNMLREKEDDSITLNRKETVPNILPIADLEGEMLWEKSKAEEGEKKSDEDRRGKEKCRESGLMVSAVGLWADEDLSPLAMFFTQEKGWVSKKLGPKSGHWKRIARKQIKASPTKKGSQNKTKRMGPVDLKELDPKALNSKRRKEILKEGNDIDESEETVGGEAVVVAQHRRAT